MPLVNQLNLIQPPHIEGIGVPVLVAHCEVKRLLRVPSQCTALVHQHRFLQWSLASDVVDEYSSVHRCAGDHVLFDGVELDPRDSVDSPVPALDRRGSFLAPQLHHSPASYKCVV